MEKVTVHNPTSIVATLDNEDTGYKLETIDLKLQQVKYGKPDGRNMEGKLVFWVANQSGPLQNDIDKDGKVVINMPHNMKDDLIPILENDVVNIVYNTETHEVDFTNKID